MSLIRLSIVSLLSLAAWVTSAAAMTPLGKIVIPGNVVAARASVGAKICIVVSQDAGNQQMTLHVLDTQDPDHLRVLGALTLPNVSDVALSDDGSAALLLVAQDPRGPRRESTHELISVDLSNPHDPQLRWRKQYAARSAVLASKAHVFAYSRLTPGKDGQWETVIVSGRNRQQLALIEEGPSSDGTMSLSPSGEFLAQASYGGLRLWDFKSAPQGLYANESLSSNRFEYQCIPAVLDSGHVVMTDARVARVGVYAPRPGMPRVAALPTDSAFRCHPLQSVASDTSLFFTDEFDRITEANFRDPISPSIASVWQMPLGYAPLAAFGGMVLAVQSEKQELRFFRLGSSPAAPFDDWQGLVIAHRAVLGVRHAKQHAASFTNQWKAVTQMEKAGAVIAISASVKGVSHRRAAAVLNDYGILASRMGRPSHLVEAALRRSIELDPGRATAHLDLADFLRASLGLQSPRTTATLVSTRQIEAHYRAYLSAGGKPTAAINSFLRGDPAAGIESECESISAWTNAGRLSELVARVATDVPWNGKRVDLIFTTQGTAHVPHVEMFNARDDQELSDEQGLEALPVPEGLWGGDQLGLLTLREQHYLVHYRDWKHPVSAAPLNGGSACQFQVDTREIISLRAAEPQLCKALSRPGYGAGLTFEEESSVVPEQLQLTWPQSSIDGTRKFDFANDGKEVRVARIQLSSTAGPGCEATFYDLLDDTGRRLAGGRKRDQLLQLQAADASSRYPVHCGNQARFFLYKGRVYFETKPASWPPQDERDTYHRVTTIRDGKASDVCRFELRSRISPKAR